MCCLWVCVCVRVHRSTPHQFTCRSLRDFRLRVCRTRLSRGYRCMRTGERDWKRKREGEKEKKKKKKRKRGGVGGEERKRLQPFLRVLCCTWRASRGAGAKAGASSVSPSARSISNFSFQALATKPKRVSVSLSLKTFRRSITNAFRLGPTGTGFELWRNVDFIKERWDKAGSWEVIFWVIRDQPCDFVDPA